jgi:hypothetical protein
MKRSLRLPVLLSAIFFLYGCAAVLLGVGAGVGIGTYKYIEGNLERDYPLAYSRAWDDANTALTNLKISITSSNNDGEKGTIEGVRRDGSKVTVKLKDKSQNITLIKVRAGILGDRELAEKIHDEIAATAGL